MDAQTLEKCKMKILIIQTAFIGDVILTLPLAQEVKSFFPSPEIDFIVIPSAQNLLENNPAISQTIVFDKRKKDSGVGGTIRVSKKIREQEYDTAFIPHRSLRSALLAKLANIKERVGFSTSAGKFLFTKNVHYEQSLHEIERNLSLLHPFGYSKREKVFPILYPSENDKTIVNDFLTSGASKIIAIAPGTVWNTKRWLKGNFIKLGKLIASAGYSVVLVGGKDDNVLCEEIKTKIDSSFVINSAGQFTLLQSAEILRRCSLLVCNDSAPLHLAVAMKTPVVSIFGATVPRFGFYPYGENDIVIEDVNLACRPCSIHGGDKCPLETFDCMKNISAGMVFEKVKEKLQL